MWLSTPQTVKKSKAENLVRFAVTTVIAIIYIQFDWFFNGDICRIKDYALKISCFVY